MVLKINAWHPRVVVAALIDAGCMVMRPSGSLSSRLGRTTTLPIAEAARKGHREFAGAKCDRFAGRAVAGPVTGDSDA